MRRVCVGHRHDGLGSVDWFGFELHTSCRTVWVVVVIKVPGSFSLSSPRHVDVLGWVAFRVVRRLLVRLLGKI